jgi:hypothetical protein
MHCQVISRFVERLESLTNGFVAAFLWCKPQPLRHAVNVSVHGNRRLTRRKQQNNIRSLRSNPRKLCERFSRLLNRQRQHWLECAVVFFKHDGSRLLDGASFALVKSSNSDGCFNFVEVGFGEDFGLDFEPLRQGFEGSGGVPVRRVL